MTEADASSGFYNNNAWHAGIRIHRIKTHVAIFKAYAELHEAASIMAERMDEVLDNEEHHMIMREARELGYIMPDSNAIRSRNALLKEFLTASDPWNDAENKEGMIFIPGKTARDLHMVAYQCALMIDEVCRNIRESDYMLLFRNLRRLDFPYVGPTSLQEMFNVWGTLIVSMQQQEQHGPERHQRLPANWLKLV
jgi:hypothetical protein